MINEEEILKEIEKLSGPKVIEVNWGKAVKYVYRTEDGETVSMDGGTWMGMSPWMSPHG